MGNRGRADKDMFADNATVEDPVGSEIKEGKDAIVEFYQGAFEMGALLELDGAARVAGNSVAFAFTVIIGEMRISPIDVFEVNQDGKVVSMKAYWGADNMKQ